MKGRKVLYGVSILAVFIINCLYYNYQFFLMFALIILVPLISWGMFIMARMGLKLKCTFSNNNVMLGDDLNFKIIADNDTPVGITWGRVKMNVAYSNMRETKMLEKFVSLDNSGNVRENVVFTPMHCGVVSVYISEFEVRDLIQLFSVKYKYGSVRKAAIFPQQVTIEDEDILGYRQEEEYKQSYTETDNTEVMDLRQYVDGDSLNKIHWKLSMNSEDFIVKQYGQEIKKRKSIVVDLSYYEDSDFRDNLDLIYQAVYSIGALYTRKNVDSRIIAWDDSVADLYIGEFDDEDSLDSKMAELMEIKCQPDNMRRLNFNLENTVVDDDEIPMLITASNLESDIYEIVNVKRDDLTQVLLNIATRN